MITHIACISKNRGLGKDGNLIVKDKDDMAFFKRVTMDSTVVMGRKTWESLPGKLKRRRNCVVTKQEGYNYRSPDLVINDVNLIPEIPLNEKIFIIGGAEIFAATFGMTGAIILNVFNEDLDADVFYPEIPSDFRMILEEPLNERITTQYYRVKF